MNPIFTDEKDSLPQWITLLYEKVDGDSMEYLRHQDKEYQEILERKRAIQKQYPCIDRLIDDDGAIQINEKEHEMFLEYLALRNAMDYRERELYYWYGHVHCYEYMKKIGALSNGNE